MNKDVANYLNQLEPSRKEALERVIQIFEQELDEGFELQISYKMPSFVVPHRVFPQGYHCDPKQALPFVSFASQKNFIALYHMGIYSKEGLLNWFVKEWPKHSSKKLDMGKSCLRFKQEADIPYELLRQLARKMSSAEWISIYTALLQRPSKGRKDGN